MRKPRILILFAILGLALISCRLLSMFQFAGSTPAEPLKTTPSPEVPISDEDSLKKPNEDPHPIVEPEMDKPNQGSEIPETPLASNGPWYVFSTLEGLFAINPDGSGLTQFYADPINSPYPRQILVSPKEGYLAYIEGERYDAVLRINKFPEGTLITRTPLLSFSSDQDLDAMRAIVEQKSLSFSPDGRSLAFMGMIEAPTSDLYLFALDTFEVTRLTDIPSQAYQPVWSPDGKYIVHTGVRSFGTGAGYAMAGVWASHAATTDAISLYDPSGSGSENILGWIDNQIFIVYSWGFFCGEEDLRTFNIETKQSTVLWQESFRGVAFDPSNKVALLISNDGECGPEDGAGIYLVPTNGYAPLRVLENTGSQVIWSEDAGLFMASGDFGSWVIAVDSMGQFIDLDMPQSAQGFPAVAPGSRLLAWKGKSLWIGPLLGSIENPPEEVFNEPVYNVTWTPDGESVIFFANSGLYIAHQPDYTPILIADGLDNQNGYSDWLKP
jgi:WD40 repeat protein